MRSMVVLFALCAVSYGSLVPLLAQPPHHPAVVLDPHGRPLDTAEVIGARALHLQAKALEHGHGIVAPVLGHSYAAAPLLGHSLAASPLLGHGLLGHGLGHLLKKRSLGLAHAVPVASHSSVSAYDVSINHGTPIAVAHAAPIAVAHAAPIAVAHAAPIAVAAPVLSAHSAWATPAIAAHSLGLSAHGLGLGHGIWKRSLGLYGHSAHLVAAPLISHAIAAPVVKYVGGSAVSHQSRVDVQTSPAVVAHSVHAPVVSHSVVAAPVVAAHSTWATPAIAAHGFGLSGLGLGHGLGLAGHGHLLKKRSLAPLALAHGVPAVSHQSRVDVISSHAPLAVAHAAPLALSYAAPLAVAHAPAVSHQSRVEVISSGAHLAPIAHSAVWSAPAHLSHSGLLHGAW